MTADFKLNTRQKNGKAAKLRTEGLIPAVIYGKHFEAESFCIDKKEFARLFKEAGTSNLIELHIGDKKIKTLIHDYQKDPITGDVVHIDFLKINMKEKIHAEIPLEFVGESNAVINLDGSLITPVDSVEVECLPADLPSEIQVDLSVLEDFEKDIRISNIKIPEGVVILNDPEEVVAMVQEPRSEEELEALEGEVVEDISAIEVENAGEAPAEGEQAEEKKEE